MIWLYKTGSDFRASDDSCCQQTATVGTRW